MLALEDILKSVKNSFNNHSSSEQYFVGQEMSKS
jgi:hypothetical protein